jgi:hypothetical protein
MKALFLCSALLLGAFAPGAGCSAKWDRSRSGDARPTSYTNPVYAGSMPDPSVIRHKGIYYAFGTTGNERLPDGQIFTVLRSRNLVEWENRVGLWCRPRPTSGINTGLRR